MANWNDTDQRQGFGSVPRAGDAVARQETFDAGLRAHMLKIYNYMASGVLLTGLVAMLTARSGLALTFASGAGFVARGFAGAPKDHGIDEVCQSCHMCTRFCPGQAIRPQNAEVNGVLRWYVDTPACEPYFHKLYGCKICLMVCPLNARGVFRG